ncbi:MAG: proton-conducting transporter membrane subunit [Roseovarius sp.]|nr:proton-conducting transporter membrane subunit [Roseovarius sp.]
MTAFLVLLVGPLAGALAAIALPGRAARAAAAAAIAATLVAAVGLAGQIVTQGVLRLELGGWAPPLGIALEADGLSAVLLVMTALVMTAVGLAARHELAPDIAGPRAAFGFWPLMLLLWAALNAVFLSRDLFNLYVGLELLSLAAIGLVAIGGTAAAFAAAIRYMIFALAGSLLYLAGVILIYAAHGTLDMDLLAGLDPAASDGLALALMTGGLLAKTALFPFHVWLPPAHGSAPSPASAMLSALVPKASFVILLRLWLDAMPDRAGEGALILLAMLGTAAVIWGSVRAIAQARLKLIVAYSTVAQIGYLFLIFPLAGGAAGDLPWMSGAWNGTIMLIVSHALAKSAMFLVAGQWMRVAGSDRLTDLRGLALVMPMSTAAFAMAAVTLAGLPPSGGFTGKYLIMTAAFASGQWVWALVMAVGGILAAVYLYRPLAVLFTFSEASDRAPLSRATQVVPLVLAGASIGLGIASAGLFEILSVGRPPVVGEGP